MDRGEVNALLRQLFTGITVEYDTGHLRFAWRHGGETSITFDWSKLFKDS